MREIVVLLYLNNIALLELQALESIILPPDSATNSCPGKLCKVYKFREILLNKFWNITFEIIIKYSLTLIDFHKCFKINYNKFNFFL